MLGITSITRIKMQVKISQICSSQMVMIISKFTIVLQAIRVLNLQAMESLKMTMVLIFSAAVLSRMVQANHSTLLQANQCFRVVLMT